MIQKQGSNRIGTIATLSFALILALGLSAGSHTTGKAAKADIVDTAIAAGSFQTLVTAVQAADLVETLKGEGPFTVFAPTDEAFAKLPKGTLDALLLDKQKLAEVLTYHVVSGNITSDKVAKMTAARTVNGENLKIRIQNGSVWVDNAKVIQTDILTSNGVIHVIDAVVLP